MNDKLNYHHPTKRCKILEQIQKNDNFKTIRVDACGLKKRTLKVRDETVILNGYCDCKTK
jgi:hypothetical protein